MPRACRGSISPHTSARRALLTAPLPWAQCPVFRSRYFEVLGLQMHVRMAGTGEKVLLLHGLGVSGRYFMPLARVLAEKRRVVIPDLPGWGLSERPVRPLGIGGAADVLAEFLGRCREPATPIVANSFGCQVTLMLAQRRPDLGRGGGSHGCRHTRTGARGRRGTTSARPRLTSRVRNACRGMTTCTGPNFKVCSRENMRGTRPVPVSVHSRVSAFTRG